MLKRIAFSSPERDTHHNTPRYGLLPRQLRPYGTASRLGRDVQQGSREPLWLWDVSQACPKAWFSEMRKWVGTHRADFVWGSTIFEKQCHNVRMSLLGCLVQRAVS